MARNPEKTRQKIISSAKELFIRQGYKGTTTKQVAKDAGISEMTLFRHFPTKELVFRAVIQPLNDFLEKLHFLEVDDIKTQIKELLQDRLSFLCIERDLVRFAIMESHLAPIGFNPVEEAAQKIRNLLSSVETPRRELYLRVIMGYVLTWIFLPEDCEDGSSVDRLVDLLQ